MVVYFILYKMVALTWSITIYCLFARANPSNVQTFKKLKEMTTYSVKSMSTCSMTTTIQGDNAPLLSTVKSMSMCSTPHGCISEQLQDDTDVIEADVLQPQNSTFIEEDFHVDLQDIFPQDLSAIIGNCLKKKYLSRLVSKSYYYYNGLLSTFFRHNFYTACSAQFELGKECKYWNLQSLPWGNY